MNVTVIVVAYNEEANIRDCLDSLIVQHYASGEFEILVVDGCSDDRTPEIVAEYANAYGFVRLVQNPGRTVSSNRNTGVQHARFSYVAFTDADCICPAGWLEQLAQGYRRLMEQDIRLGAVGGGNLAKRSFGPVAEAISIAYNSYLSAMGSVQTRRPAQMTEVSNLGCLNIWYAKHTLEENELFDELLGNVGEDWDLNYRLHQKGYRFFYLPEAVVFHKMRQSFRSFARQMFQYGKGRARLIERHGLTSLQYLIPMLFVVIMIASAFMLGITGYAGFGLPFAYFPIILAFSSYLCVKQKRWSMIGRVSLIYFLIHFQYGFGEWAGMLRRIRESGAG